MITLEAPTERISDDAAPETSRLVTEGETYEAARAALDAALPEGWRLVYVRRTGGH